MLRNGRGTRKGPSACFLPCRWKTQRKYESLFVYFVGCIQSDHSELLTAELGLGKDPQLNLTGKLYIGIGGSRALGIYKWWKGEEIWDRLVAYSLLFNLER